MGAFAYTADWIVRNVTQLARRSPTPPALPSGREIGGGRMIVPSFNGRPDLGEFSDLVVGQADAWDLNNARAALASHETGIFTTSALLADFMFRDDRVAACYDTRVSGIQGLPFSCQPSVPDNRRALKVADALDEDWGWMCPPHVLEDAVQWEDMMGFALFELVWNTTGSRWIPQPKFVHPQFIWYNTYPRYFVVNTEQGAVRVTPGDGRWFLFSRHAEYRCWMRGAIRPLSVPWAGRAYGYRDWGRYNERYGAPMKRARVPFNAVEAEKQAYFSAVKAMGAMGTILSAQKDDYEKFDVELIEPSSQVAGGNTFGGLMDRCDEAINMVVLGQNLSGGTEKGGSLAKAEVGENVRGDKKVSDTAAFGACAYAQMVHPWTAFNFGDDAYTPQPTWDTKPPEDKSKNATVFKTVMEAAEIAERLGIPIDNEQLIEKYELPIDAIEETDDEQPDDSTPAEHAGPTKDQTTALNGAQIASMLEIVTNVATGAIPRDTGINLIVAAFPLSIAQVEQIMGAVGQGFTPTQPTPPPASNASPAKQLSRSKVDPLAHALSGQVYVDSVSDRATKQAAKSVRAGVLDVVMGLVADSHDYDQLRVKLTQAFPDMDVTALNRITEGALKLSLGAGAFSARKEAE